MMKESREMMRGESISLIIALVRLYRLYKTNIRLIIRLMISKTDDN